MMHLFPQPDSPVRIPVLHGNPLAAKALRVGDFGLRGSSGPTDTPAVGSSDSSSTPKKPLLVTFRLTLVLAYASTIFASPVDMPS